MNTSVNLRKQTDPKVLLSSLWIFLSVNYIYRDILTNMEPGAVQGFLAGNVGGVTITQGFLLIAALMMEIPFAMILLSRVLKGTAYRWANTIAAILMIVIEIGTMGIGTPPTLHYLFYSVIVIVCNLFIIWYALKRHQIEG